MSRHTTRLRVSPIACSCHGVCAELLPELVTLDEWGYPLVAGDGTVPAWLTREARRAVAGCPALALALTSAPAEQGGRSARSVSRGNAEEAQSPAGRRTGTLGT